MSSFIGFALLSECSFDIVKFADDLKETWSIDIHKQIIDKNKDEIFVFEIENTFATISLLPEPIPNKEAELNAHMNYHWPEALEKAKAHTAHLLITILGDNSPLLQAKLFVKLNETCCKQDNVLAIYQNTIVINPVMYIDFASFIHNGYFPIHNLVWFGLYITETGINGYTLGLTAFGKDEIEIIGSNSEPSEVYDFMVSVSSYVIESDITLNDGETIGLNTSQKLPITRSNGVAVNDMSLKIEFNK